MKLKLIALSTLMALSSIANAAPQTGEAYVGAKAGWATVRDGLTQFNSKSAPTNEAWNDGQGYGINRNSVTYGVYGGYQFLNAGNFGLAGEVGYDYYGRVRGNVKFDGKETRAAKHTAHGVNFALKPSYTVLPNLDVYSKVGLALIRNDYYIQPTVAHDSRLKAHHYKPSLILGGGLEYSLTDNLAARVEYQFINKVGNLDKAIKKGGYNYQGTEYSPDIHSVSVGLSYRFGSAPVITPVEPKEVVNKTFSFNSDVMFDFGKYNLRPEATQSLDNVVAEIQTVQQPQVKISGYTDRIGKDMPNMKLSQQRAESVANYVVSRGVDANSVVAVGYGKANSTVGSACDNVKGRKALIACLAPDRRVELNIQGYRTETATDATN